MLAVMSDISKRAEELAAQHPAGEVLENSLLWLITAIGGFFGFLALAVKWTLHHAWSLVFVVALAFSAGYRKTSKPAVKIPVQPGPVQLMEDERTIDSYQTPFGIPFGPNVQASHD